MDGLRYDEACGDADVAAFARVMSEAFTWPEEGCRTFIGLPGGENRVARLDGRVVGALQLVPMGQFWGGKRVEHWGVAGVVVEIEARNRGVGTFLMREAVREMAGKGVAMSGLFPATLPVYRKAGYEQAGLRWETVLEPRLIGVRERGVVVRRARDGDWDWIRAVYGEEARAHSGFMDRGEYVWEGKVRTFGDEPTEVFVVEGVGGGVDGYVAIARQRGGRLQPPELHVRDWSARTSAAARALLAFVADHWSTMSRVVVATGPMDGVLGVLPERIWQSRVLDQWMIRLVDVGAAMMQRGYACGDARLVFEVEDELVEANRGRWALEVRDGVGSWTPCGDAGGEVDVVRCGARGLAQVYSGYRPAVGVRLAGLIEGDDAAVAALDRVFGAGAGAWMREIY